MTFKVSASNMVRWFLRKKLLPLMIVLFVIATFILQRHSKESCQKTEAHKKTYVAFGRKLDSGYLDHVYEVLEENGYSKAGFLSDWDLLWAHDYPFKSLKDDLLKLRPHQKVNHFPGSGYITNKANLAVSDLPHVPKAFKMPFQKNDLLNYVKQNPNRMFVQKSNNHRGIRVQKIDDLNLDVPGTFIQEFVHKPLLIDGHKFDIGVYTIITSINPMRAYFHAGEILFRFCPEPYHPFNASNVDKYVVGDDYLPLWEVPSLQRYYTELGYGMKESFNAHMRSIGKNPSLVWDKIQECIRAVLLSRETALIAATSKFPSFRNFFEMMRFDFVVDEDLNVYLMEANMSPNLSSHHFPPNRIIYEQVLYSLFSLVGVIRRTWRKDLTEAWDDQPEVAYKDLAVFAEKCRSAVCSNCTAEPACRLCKTCSSSANMSVLRDAFLEHVSRHTCKRLIPPPMTSDEASHGLDLTGLTEENRLMYEWFRGKCLLDSTWCS